MSQLAAEGMTNTVIGEALFDIVETHLRKLGIDSRAQPGDRPAG